MKNQALFSSKDKSEKLKCRLLQFSTGAFWVKFIINFSSSFSFDLKLISKYYKLLITH